ncbi:DMT family transporter [Microbaculum marinum]|uniref:DMT family transporter n=1 Tax=Microbaculum marinum TaxID=1764581 RepID=A0AAW9RPG9_9HYPH
MTRSLANLTLLFAAFIWGTAFVAQATAMQDIGPFLFTGLRFMLAVPAILPFAIREARRNPPIERRNRRLIVLNGAAFFLGTILQQIGIQFTSVTNAGFLTGIYVVLVPFAAWALFRSMPHRIVWPAAAISLVGTFLLSGGGLVPLGLGDVLILAGSLFWAAQVALLGLLMARTGRPVTVAVAQFAIGAVLSLAIAPLVEPIAIDRIAAAGVEILYAGLLSGGIAYTLQAIGQRWTPPADAAVILSSEAVFAAVAGALIMGDRLTAAGLVGAGLILAAILLVQLWPGRGRS